MKEISTKRQKKSPYTFSQSNTDFSGLNFSLEIQTVNQLVISIIGQDHF